MSTMGIPDTHKFENADQILNSTNVRLTFQSWQDIILAGSHTISDGKGYIRRKDVLQTFFDFYNLITPHSSSEVHISELHLDLAPPEPSAPDVFVMNPAMAYVLFKQSFPSYTKFIDDFTELMEKSFKAGYRKQKIRGYWYANPFIHGTAHGGTEHITETRNSLYSALTKERVEKIGMAFLDPVLYTSMRPEESWDGLHYLRGYSQWNGHVAATVVQAFLNELFGECHRSP